jgi:hypothetical protein
VPEVADERGGGEVSVEDREEIVVWEGAIYKWARWEGIPINSWPRFNGVSLYHRDLWLGFAHSSRYLEGYIREEDLLRIWLRTVEKALGELGWPTGK